MTGAADYELTIAGTWNARDVGGRSQPAGWAAPLATGVLYRSASLSALTDDGVRALDQLDVRTVLDLRADDEAARDGQDIVPPTATVIHLPFGKPDQSNGGTADLVAMVKDLLQSRTPGDAGREMMMSVYRGFVTDPDAHGAMLRGLTAIAERPGATLVHCSAGKDRTGWLVALVQYICAVPSDEILDEYLLSRAAAVRLRAALPPYPGINPQMWEPILGVEPEYLSAAVEAAKSLFGSLTGYLSAIGVSADMRDAIASRFGRQNGAS